MASQITLDVRPLQTPHLDIDHLPLANRDFQIKDTISLSHLLKLHCWSKDKFLNRMITFTYGNQIFPNTCSHRYTYSQKSSTPAKLAMSQVKEPQPLLTNKFYSPLLQSQEIKCCGSSQTQMRPHFPLKPYLNSTQSWTFPRELKYFRLSPQKSPILLQIVLYMLPPFSLREPDKL